MRMVSIMMLCLFATACNPNNPMDPEATQPPIVQQPVPAASGVPLEAEAPVVLPSGWYDDLDDTCQEPEPQRLASAPRSPCSRMCANMRDIKCREGNTPDGGKSCEQNCAHVTASKFMPLDVECAAHASSKTAARKCAGITCH